MKNTLNLSRFRQTLAGLCIFVTTMKGFAGNGAPPESVQPSLYTLTGPDLLVRSTPTASGSLVPQLVNIPEYLLFAGYNFEQFGNGAELRNFPIQLAYNAEMADEHENPYFKSLVVSSNFGRFTAPMQGTVAGLGDIWAVFSDRHIVDDLESANPKKGERSAGAPWLWTLGYGVKIPTSTPFGTGYFSALQEGQLSRQLLSESNFNMVGLLRVRGIENFSNDANGGHYTVLGDARVTATLDNWVAVNLDYQYGTPSIGLTEHQWSVAAEFPVDPAKGFWASAAFSQGQIAGVSQRSIGLTFIIDPCKNILSCLQHCRAGT